MCAGCCRHAVLCLVSSHPRVRSDRRGEPFRRLLDEAGLAMGTDAETNSLPGTPSELPFTQQSELPSQLDFGSQASGADIPRSQDLPDELPFSQGIGEGAGRTGEDRDEGDSCQPGPVTGATSGRQAPADPELHEVPVFDQQLFPDGARRRGRPSRLLQEALQEAAARAEARPQAALACHEPGGALMERGRGGALVPAAPSRVELLRQSKLDASGLKNLLKRPVEGLPLPTPLAGVLAACSQLSRLPGELLDDEVRRATTLLLEPGPLPMLTKKARADRLGVTTAKLGALLPMVGAATVVGDRSQRAAVEKHITSATASADLVLYVDCVAYDETPLPVLVRGDRPVEVASNAAEQQQIGDFGPPGADLSDFSMGSLLAQMLSSSKDAQKVLQTVQSGGMLVRVGGHYIAIAFSTVCALQVMSSGTASCIAEAQRRTSGATRASKAFCQNMRIVCTDRASANIAAERALRDERGDSWSTLHSFCDVHRTAGAHTKTFVLLASNVSGMIRCALALRNGAALSRFRTCLAQEIASRFKVKHGSPTAEAKAYKMGVLRLFVSHGAQLAVRRLLLALCPNGDWRREEVEYYPPPGRPRQPTEVYLKHVTAGLIIALSSAQPSIYPRHRWTGADLATDCLGVMEACHRLLSTAFARFVASFEPNARARRILAMAAEGSNDQAAAGTAARPDVSGADASTISAGVDSESAIAVAAGQAQPIVGDEPAWAAINTTNRRLALAWLTSTPLAELILQRLTMEPLRQLMTFQFRIASDAWEVEQRASLAKAMSRDGGATFADRDYRLCIAAEGREEARCLEQLGLLFEQPVLSDLSPPSAFTVGFRALAFRVWSRAGCAVKELFFPNQRFPLRTCLLLGSPDIAGQLARVPDCVLDPWTLKLKSQHPSFEGDELRQKLFLACMLGMRDITQVEAKHATIRRHLMQGSLQTDPMDLPDLSALWCVTQVRRREQQIAVRAGLQVAVAPKQALGVHTPPPIV